MCVGERAFSRVSGVNRERVNFMTSDLVQAAYAGQGKSQNKGQGLELTRAEGFLSGVQDIFDLLGGKGDGQAAEPSEINVMELLKTAYRAIARSEKTITEQKQRIAELESRLTVDELTGMTNRRGFFEAFTREIDRANRNKDDGGLLIMIDIDNFKTINDTYGHQAGDECLKLVGAFLMNEVRAMDVAARLGGDEFILLFPRTNREKAMKRAQHLAVRLNALTAEWKGQTIPIYACVGLRNFVAGDQIEDIIEDADAALYEHKRTRKAGRNAS